MYSLAQTQMNTTITALITTVTSQLTAVASQLTLRGFSAETVVYPETTVGSAALVLTLSNNDVSAALRLCSDRDATLGKRRRDLATAEESLKKARLAVEEAEEHAKTAKEVQRIALEKQTAAILNFNETEAAACSATPTVAVAAASAASLASPASLPS